MFDKVGAMIGTVNGVVIALVMVSNCLPNDTLGMVTCGGWWLIAIPAGYAAGGFWPLFFR